MAPSLLGISEWAFNGFVISYVLALIIKVVDNFRGGDWKALQPGGYNYWFVKRSYSPGVASAMALFYPPALILRLIATILVLCPATFHIALVLIFVTIWAELIWRYRSNMVLLMLMSLLLMLGPAPHLGSPGISGHETQIAAIVLLIVSLYLNSSWTKFKSEEFRNGRILQIMLYGVALAPNKLTRWEIPSSIVLLARRNLTVSQRILRFVAVLVIVIEMVMPFGLVFPGVWPVFVVIGALMHLAFAVLFPMRLIPFQVATIGSYGLFLSLYDPAFNWLALLPF